MITVPASVAPASDEDKVASAPPEIFALPVSCAQRRIWFLDQLLPGTALHNIPVAVRLEGPLEAATLEQALNQLIRRHEILRTCFDLHEGAPAQVVVPRLCVKLRRVDLSSYPPADRESEFRRQARAEAQRPFMLKQLPLFRAALLRYSDTEHILLLSWHHIIFDGWSLGVFFRELVAFYEGFRAGTPVELPELPIQYADFAIWQRDRIRALDQQLAWWKKQLAGPLPVLELPTDRPRPARQTYTGAVETLALPAQLHHGLVQLGRREESTLFMTLLAAFQTLLHRSTSQEDMLVGSPSAGRTLTETEGLIGCFINLLVLRGNLSGNPTFRKLLGRVRESAVGAYANEELPFERLLEELRPGRNRSQAPLVQVMFALEQAPFETVNWPGFKLAPIDSESGTAKLDLSLYMVEGAHGLTARMEYNADLFDATTIQRMLKQFRVLLDGIVSRPDNRLSDLPLLTEAERHQLLIEWSPVRDDHRVAHTRPLLPTNRLFVEGYCTHGSHVKDV